VYSAYPATMQDFWDKNAYFEFQNRIPNCGADCGMAGTDIVVKGGAWHMFSRELFQGPSYCSPPGATHNYNSFRVFVRKSTDKGKTWADKTTIIEPKANTPYECQAADGDAYFDESTNIWRYVYQCLGRDYRWHMRYAYKQGQDPMGAFTQSTLNPMSGIWKRICYSPDDDCYKMSGNIDDEGGAPEIVERRNDDFYITFYGYDGVYGYRGIARTRDFKNWRLVNMEWFGNKLPNIVINVSTHPMGDVNLDTNVDILDAQKLVNIILGQDTATSPADVNQDSSVDVLDI
jgi:hypothetical protein